MIPLEIAKAISLLLGIALGISCFFLLKYFKNHGIQHWKDRWSMKLLFSFALTLVLCLVVELNRAPIEQRIRYEVNDPEQLAALAVVAGDTKQIRIRKESNELGFLQSPVYQSQLAGLGLSLLLMWFVDARKLKQEAERTKTAKPLNFDREEKLAALNRLLKVEKLYHDQELSLDALAEKLGISRYQLSQLMNEALGKNFYALINEYRVKEALELLNDPEADDSTLLALGYQVGFNSKASFYRAFKKHTNLTPAQYKKNLC